MSKMKELYEKVAADSKLQVKFEEIMKGAEEAGEEATKESLSAFAKEAGYDVTVNEMQEFFKDLAESKNGTLSDLELDQVAGGKSVGGGLMIFNSVASIGVACLAASVGAMKALNEPSNIGVCSKVFE